VERHRDRWVLFRHGSPVDVCLAVMTEPGFYRQSTSDGVPFQKIALFHGADCLASTVLQSCVHWGSPAACGFCGIGLSLRDGNTVRSKKPEQLAEAAVAAAGHGARHVTLTAGTTRDRALETNLYEASARAIRQAAGLPVHVQLMPPVSREGLERLRRAGVVSVGLHRESFDEGVLRRVAPCKASLPLESFVEAWREGVGVFGRGQVSSFVLLGLGEDDASLEEGCRLLAGLGVYPYPVPFRPIPGTPLGDLPTAEPLRVRTLLPRIAQILQEQGLDWGDVGAGCVRCRGCSPLPDYQDALARAQGRAPEPSLLAWEVVRSGPFLEAAHAIRHEVFVREQRLFRETDRDERDRDSIHIVARRGSRCVGTVRITPQGDGVWLGSRLAVRRGMRGTVGTRLVVKAEEEVARRGGRLFLAYIQPPRVPFFRRCGWRSIETVPDYCGSPHVLMQAAGGGWGHDPRFLSDFGVLRQRLGAAAPSRP
jgi:radical SAM protein (TIGR04043 family)/putative N-acetyltransferase (TIGR04045 family)